MHERLVATVSGRVQMVMYRDFAQRKARGLKLAGTVQNKDDGTVHIVAEGTRTKLESYLRKLEGGPLLARVDRVRPEWLPANGEHDGFRILYG